MFKIWVGGGTLLNMWAVTGSCILREPRRGKRAARGPWFSGGLLSQASSTLTEPPPAPPRFSAGRGPDLLDLLDFLSWGCGGRGSLRKDCCFRFCPGHCGVGGVCLAPEWSVGALALPLHPILLKIAQAQGKACISHAVGPPWYPGFPHPPKWL